jgi:hypothetical protein
MPMKTPKSTPLQILQKKKIRLQAQSQALLELLESDIDLVQHHFGAILAATITQTLAAKAPEPLRSLLNKNTSSSNPNPLLTTVLNLVPLLLKTAKQYLLPLLFLRMQSRRKERKNSDPASKKKASNKKTSPSSKK